MHPVAVAQGHSLRSLLVIAITGLAVFGVRIARAQQEASPPADLAVESVPVDAVPAPPAPQPPLAPQTPPGLPAPAISTDPGDLAAQEADASNDLGYQPILQGPVHEAFAMPVDGDVTDAVQVRSQPPPKPIDEQPPQDKPSGERVTWISGYWSWSEEANKYVWVSGLYRNVPPGRSWVSGYWSETSEGYRWTSGYWTQAGASEASAEYLPAPPQSIDNGPSVPPPSDDHFWLPGQWEYVGGQYQWRSGYWTQHYEGWVWQPACYNDTPNGFVYVNGYWDVLPTDRGQLYAPVDFYSPAYLEPNYVYRPRYPLADAADLLLHLFVRPGYRHYYYGDFYGPSYASLGFRPWYDVGFGLSFFSPWNRYYDWNYRHSGIDFYGSMNRYKEHYRANPSQRPPKSYGGASQRQHSRSRSFDDYVRSDVGGRPVRTVSRGHSGRASQPSAGSITGSQATRSSGSHGVKSSIGSTQRAMPSHGSTFSRSPRSIGSSASAGPHRVSGSGSGQAFASPSMAGRTSVDRTPGNRGSTRQSTDSRVPFSGSTPTAGSISRGPSFSGRSSTFQRGSSPQFGSSIGRSGPSSHGSPSISHGNRSSQGSPSFRSSSPFPSGSALRGGSSIQHRSSSSHAFGGRGSSGLSGGSPSHGGFSRGNSSRGNSSRGGSNHGNSSRGGGSGKSRGGGRGK